MMVLKAIATLIVAEKEIGNKRAFKAGEARQPCLKATPMLRDPDLHNAISGASKAVPDAFHCNPYADPTSETAQRYARIEAALDDLLQLSPRGPADVHYWINRVLSGWPGYGYDNVNTLEAVVRAYRAFDVELRKYNREPASRALRKERLQ